MKNVARIASLITFIYAAAGSTAFAQNASLFFSLDSNPIAMGSHATASARTNFFPYAVQTSYELFTKNGWPSTVGPTYGNAGTFNNYVTPLLRTASTDSASIDSLDFGLGKFGVRARAVRADGTTVAVSPAFDLHIVASCAGTTDSGVQVPYIVRPVASGFDGEVARNGMYQWNIDYEVTACSVTRGFTMQAVSAETRYPGLAPRNLTYTYNNSNHAQVKVPALEAGQTFMIRVTATGTIPSTAAIGSQLYIEPTFQVNKISSARTYEQFSSPVAVTVVR
jgi:hypothetical protein